MSTEIIIFTYIRQVKYNVQILNGRKEPAKGFGLVIIKIPQKNIIISLWSSYYMRQNPQNTINKTTLKDYNQFRNIITEVLIWLLITTDKGMKPKDEKNSKKEINNY